MSLEGGKIRCVALLSEPGKAERGVMHEEPFSLIFFLPQKYL